jgi:hypothetical protein
VELVVLYSDRESEPCHLGKALASRQGLQ